LSDKIKILIAAGGTGGHFFPALAVVQKLVEMNPLIEPIFAGRADKIEGEKVPELGWQFVPLDIMGMPGLMSPSMFKFAIKITKATRKISKFIKENDIKLVLATGAYISVPPGIAARRAKCPLFIMESNVNLGKALKFLVGRSEIVFTSFEDTHKYIEPKFHSKIRYYGNPIRHDILEINNIKNARERLNLDPDMFTLLVFGGSLGANSINNAIEDNISLFKKHNIQVIWQTGKGYQPGVEIPENIRMCEFITDMATAYASADLIMCRSGATSIAELAVVGKPAILVPYPYASNQEQLHNAKILEEADASILITDGQISDAFFPILKHLLAKPTRIKQMSENIKKFARTDAVDKIAQDIIKYL
jgi:UDP-N-acetylglucosamine--N-acetylmuramyl-(pentapeptide) pyrophosphoryl-undecaprenol N-acetylglucosamine transferase